MDGMRRLFVLERHYPELETRKDQLGRIQLPTHEDGTCFYLTPNGCSVWDKRPDECRDWDCRDYVDDEHQFKRLRNAARLAINRSKRAAGQLK